MKRITALLLVVALLCALIPSASAAVSEPDNPNFNYIRSTGVTFLVDENGIACCYARCSANSGVTIEIVGTLQQYKNGAWSTLATWSTSGSRLVTLDKQRAVYSGYKYRFSRKFYIYDSEGSFLESDSITRTYNYGVT